MTFGCFFFKPEKSWVFDLAVIPSELLLLSLYVITLLTPLNGMHPNAYMNASLNSNAAHLGHVGVRGADTLGKNGSSGRIGVGSTSHTKPTTSGGSISGGSTLGDPNRAPRRDGGRSPRRSSSAFRLTSGWMIFLFLLMLGLCVTAVSIESPGFLNGLPLHISQVDPNTGSIFGGPELSRFSRVPLKAVGKGELPKSRAGIPPDVKSSFWSVKASSGSRGSESAQQSGQTFGLGGRRASAVGQAGGGYARANRNRGGHGGDLSHSSSSLPENASSAFLHRPHGNGSRTGRVHRPASTLREACEAEVRQFCRGEENHLRCLLSRSLKGPSDLRLSTSRPTTTAGQGGSGGGGGPVSRHGSSQGLPPTHPASVEGEANPAGSANDLLSPSCADWLGARESCMHFLQDHMRRQHRQESSEFHCSLSQSARDCLRQVPAPLLPQRCRDSDYYRAMMNARAVKGWRPEV